MIYILNDQKPYFKSKQFQKEKNKYMHILLKQDERSKIFGNSHTYWRKK